MRKLVTVPQPAPLMPISGDKEHLKEYLYHRDGVKRHHDSAVVDAVGQQGFVSPQKNGKGLDEYKAEQGKNQPHGDGKECQQCKMPSCQIFFACPQFSANDSAAAGAQHDAHTQHDIDERINDVNGRKGCRSHKTGNENKCKTEQSAKGKFFGNVVLHNMTSR